MVKGYNKATLYDKLVWLLSSEEVKSRPCVFLSHKKEDKPQCRIIAKYLSNAEVDYYLDEEDIHLQHAVNANDPHKITKRIKKGIEESSHMLVVISEKTFKSQWVPFEVGYGHSSLLNNPDNNNIIKLSILTLKDISESELPEFMQVGNVIRGTKSLNNYISKVSGVNENVMIKKANLSSHSKSKHTLDEILNWRL